MKERGIKKGSRVQSIQECPAGAGFSTTQLQLHKEQEAGNIKNKKANS